jgi:hypothetical protein
MTSKVFRGTIKDWTVHNLSVAEKQIHSKYGEGKPMIITGTVFGDPTGRRRDGDHVRTSIVVKLDRDNKSLETLNSIYNLSGKEGSDVVPPLGDAVLALFY